MPSGVGPAHEDRVPEQPLRAPTGAFRVHIHQSRQVSPPSSPTMPSSSVLSVPWRRTGSCAWPRDGGGACTARRVGGLARMVLCKSFAGLGFRVRRRGSRGLGSGIRRFWGLGSISRFPGFRVKLQLFIDWGSLLQVSYRVIATSYNYLLTRV